MKSFKFELRYKIVWRNKRGGYHREDGPAIEWKDGNKEWFINGKRHRLDGPAIIYTNGTKQWWINGKLHREDGPAYEYNTGYKTWWLKGIKYSEEEYQNELIKLKLKRLTNGKN